MYLQGLEIAIIAYVYSVILTEPGMILNGVYRYLEGRKLPDWLFKPLIDCYKCVSGQLALWSYFFLTSKYNPFEHIFFICFTIFISILLDKLYLWNLKD
jgi:hypothetical protein